MPLGVAVFLVVGGLVFGASVIPKTGVIKQRVSLGGSAFIREARGAELDSAALTVQDAPFLASADTGASQTGTAVASTQNIETFYSEGALRDPRSH